MYAGGLLVVPSSWLLPPSPLYMQESRSQGESKPITMVRYAMFKASLSRVIEIGMLTPGVVVVHLMTLWWAMTGILELST